MVSKGDETLFYSTCPLISDFTQFDNVQPSYTRRQPDTDDFDASWNGSELSQCDQQSSEITDSSYVDESSSSLLPLTNNSHAAEIYPSTTASNSSSRFDHEDSGSPVYHQMLPPTSPDMNGAICAKTTQRQHYPVDANASPSNRTDVLPYQWARVAPTRYQATNAVQDPPCIGIAEAPYQQGCDGNPLAPNRIIGEPRREYHPRTEKECQTGKYFLRCAVGARFACPTISLSQNSFFPSNIPVMIELALVRLDKELHPYILRKHTTEPRSIEQGLVDEENVLFFHVTDKDFETGSKTFKVTLIKRKQDKNITKKLIREHTLEQSMLRFTRIYRYHDGTLWRDESNVAYSCVMKEKYSSVPTLTMPSSKGPMNEGTAIKVPMQGIAPEHRDRVSIIVWTNNAPLPIPRQAIQWNEQTASFRMPACPLPQENQINVNIRIYYNEKELGSSTQDPNSAVGNNMKRRPANTGSGSSNKRVRRY